MPADGGATGKAQRTSYDLLWVMGDMPWVVDGLCLSRRLLPHWQCGVHTGDADGRPKLLAAYLRKSACCSVAGPTALGPVLFSPAGLMTCTPRSRKEPLRVKEPQGRPLAL